jgi:hypothetical protein
MEYVHLTLSAILALVGLLPAYILCTCTYNFLSGIKRALWLPPGYSVQGSALRYVTGSEDIPPYLFADIPQSNLKYHPKGIWFYHNWFAFGRACDFIWLHVIVILLTAAVSRFCFMYFTWAWL